VFASNASNNPVKEANAGITIIPEDPESVANAIIKLYDMSGDKRNQMGKNGRQYVEKNHSIPVLVDRLEELFDKLCRNYKSPT